LSNPDLSIVAWQLPSKRQLAPWLRPTTWWARCPGAPKAPPVGREALDAGSATWYSDASVPGPRRRRTLEGASTTSHA